MNGFLQIINLLRGQLNGNTHIGGKLFHIGAKLRQLFGKPLPPRLTTGNQHAARNLGVLQQLEKSLTAGLFCITLGENHRNIVAPGRADHARGSFSDGGKRDVLGPLLHPMRHSCHSGRRGKHHHVYIVQMRQTLRNKFLIFGKRDRKGWPAPSFNTVGLEFCSQTIVGCPRAHQNNRLMRESHELIFCKAKSTS